MFVWFAHSTDINECTERLDDCSDDAICINMEGSYKCTCRDGFTGDGRVCLMTQLNQDECTDGSNECSSDAECVDLEVGYRCQCVDGFSGDGTTCMGMSPVCVSPCFVSTSTILHSFVQQWIRFSVCSSNCMDNIHLLKGLT